MDHNCQHLTQVRPMSNVEIGEEGNCLNLLTVYKKKFLKRTNQIKMPASYCSSQKRSKAGVNHSSPKTIHSVKDVWPMAN